MVAFQINAQIVNDTPKTKKRKNILSDELDQLIRDAKPINTAQAQEMQKTFEALNALLEPTKKDLSIRSVINIYYFAHKDLKPNTEPLKKL